MMKFKFEVGQAVEYTPRGGAPGLFTVLRHMPEEFQAYDLKYRIRNQREGFERNVLECDLSPTKGGEDAYAKITPLRRYAGR
jgi:hypothetical protein